MNNKKEIITTEDMNNFTDVNLSIVEIKCIKNVIVDYIGDLTNMTTFNGIINKLNHFL